MSTVPATLPETLDTDTGLLPSPCEQVHYLLQSIADPAVSYQFSVDSVHVGRDPSTCQIAFPDIAVISRLHCTLFTLGRDVFVHDQSSNGTFVNGKIVRKGNRSILRHGDTVSAVNPALPESPQYSFRFALLRGGDGASGEPGAEEEEEFSELDVSRRVMTTDGVVQLKDIIGTGNFATVYRGIPRDVAREVAVKVIDKRRFALKSPDFAYSSLHSEVEILRSMNHPNIIQLLDAFDEDTRFVLVMELVRHGDLFDYIVGRGVNPFTEDEVRGLFVQLLEALLYMHSKKVVHRDLKPENILIDISDESGSIGALLTGDHQGDAKHIPPRNVVLKITDFGLAKYCGEQEVMTTMCGTPSYLAPEVLNMNRADGAAVLQGYSPKVDVWSLGIILYIMCSGAPPRDPQSGILTFNRFMDHLSASCRSLLQSMLRVNPAERADLVDICTHEWLASASVSGLHHAVHAMQLDMSATVVVVPPVAELAEDTAAEEPLVSPKRRRLE